MQAQAVSNELAGERKTQSITFPVTGDVETDFVSGVVMLANSAPYMSPQRQKMVARALGYLSTRFHEEAAEQERQAENLARMQQPGFPPQNYGNMTANDFFRKAQQSQQIAKAPHCYPGLEGLGGGYGISTASDLTGLLATGPNATGAPDE